MPLGKLNLQNLDWHALAIKIVKLAARTPLIALAIFAAGCVAFMSGLFLYRLTEFLYLKYLAEPWL